MRGVEEIPAPVGDPLPLPLQIFASRDHFSKIAGFNGAQINASRGCNGSCTYCNYSTLKRLEYREAKELKMSITAKKNCNIGRSKIRNVNTVCDEISQLWHEQKVRYFSFIDKQLLPDNQNSAIDFLDSLKSGIETRGVKNFRYGLILRGENLTEKIIDKAAETGLVNCFVNIGFGTQDEGLLFKRKIDHEIILKMINHLNNMGVATEAKLIFIHPYSTLNSIKKALLLLKFINHTSLELTSMRVLYKTTLYNNLKREGRLIGNPFGYSYIFEDKQVERFSKIFSKLRDDAFKNFALSSKIKNLFINIAMGQTLFGDKKVKWIELELKILQKNLNRLYIDVFEEALNIVQNSSEEKELEKLIYFAKCKSGNLLSKIQELELLVEHSVNKQQEKSNELLIKNYSFVSTYKNPVVNNF
ncbi:MAG: hypothetical protein JXR91_02090 [Deltaproteobacteria bacterium]|nr:hypothetical protein [Deltaproteobacteria bacterium]